MDEMFTRLIQDLADRLTGPLTLRVILQPSMAAFLAIRSGIADARQNRPAFFWALLTDPSHRAELLRDGWKSIAKVFVVAVVLDGLYQAIFRRWFYPGEALLVGTVLALVPYLIVRGPANRLARALTGDAAKTQAGSR
jgi:hypothetical protein